MARVGVCWLSDDRVSDVYCVLRFMQNLEHHDELHAVLSGFLSSVGLLAAKSA